jgi:prepilin-type N-terminal cleavage/methylation domain-containing protein
MKSLSRNSQPGFTLLEIIITLILASILGTMMYSYFGSAFIGSSTPIARLNKAFHLHEAMENITADYNNHTPWQASMSYSNDDIVIPTTKNGLRYRCTIAGTSAVSEPTWPTTAGGTVTDGGVIWTEDTPPDWDGLTAYSIGDFIIPTTNNGHRYRCTTAGTSAVSEPTWPTTKAGTVVDGTVIWTENGKLPVLKDNIDALNYGSYTVVENKYIKFNPSTNQEEDIFSGNPENILKVVIQNDLGETLTALFTSED